MNPYPFLSFPYSSIHTLPTHSKTEHTLPHSCQYIRQLRHKQDVSTRSSLSPTHTLFSSRCPVLVQGQHLNVFSLVSLAGVHYSSITCEYISWQRGMDHEDLSSAEHKSKKFRIHNLSITYIVRTWHSLTLHASSPPTVTYQKLLTASSMLSQEKYKEYMKFVNVPPVCLFHTSIFV